MRKTLCFAHEVSKGVHQSTHHMAWRGSKSCRLPGAASLICLKEIGGKNRAHRSMLPRGCYVTQKVVVWKCFCSVCFLVLGAGFSYLVPLQQARSAPNLFVIRRTQFRSYRTSYRTFKIFRFSYRILGSCRTSYRTLHLCLPLYSR